MLTWIDRDQQIVRRKTRNLELCFGTYVGTNQEKFEKISICRAILFGFLRSLVCAIRCEANKSKRRREERPIGSRKMLRDLRRRARDLAQHVAVANAHAKVRARMHNWSIWCQGSSHTIGCAMAHSDRANSTRRGGYLDHSSGDSAQFLAFARYIDKPITYCRFPAWALQPLSEIKISR